MKGIILAGGSGTRLYPITKVVNKHLLAVYDKPMIFYPISLLKQCSISDVLLICCPKDLEMYKALLGNGEKFKINITYKTQSQPRGIADAFIIGEEFIGNDSVALILGDNFLYAENIKSVLSKASKTKKGATILGYKTDNPKPFAVVNLNKNGDIVDIEEKPQDPQSNIVVPGIYFYDNNVVDITKNIMPSKRGELEITDVNKKYLEKNLLNIILLDEKTIWWDLGTTNAILEASIWVKEYQNKSNKSIGNIYTEL